MVSANYEAYRNAMRQAWEDGKISADESAILESLRKSLNISAEEHMQIEAEIRAKVEGGGAQQAPAAPQPQQAPAQPQPDPQPTPQPQSPQPAPQPQAAQPAAQPQQAPSPPDSIDDCLRLGKSAYHSGQYQTALNMCDKVLSISPDNSEALFFRKRTLSKLSEGSASSDVASGAENRSGDLLYIHMDKNKQASGEAIGSVTPPDQTPAPAPAPVPEPAPAPAAPQPAPAAPAPAPAPQPAAASGGGDPNCKSCSGSGQCHWCKGSGQCYWCKGSGQCSKCHGTGKVNGEDCQHCKGSGQCHSCKGAGQCYWCKGSGQCQKCNT